MYPIEIEMPLPFNWVMVNKTPPGSNFLCLHGVGITTPTSKLQRNFMKKKSPGNQKDRTNHQPPTTPSKFANEMTCF